jgi:uroporphyrinogen-III decarboxylase
MNSRERMIAAMEGRPVDAVPVAPYFWGAEYVWRLLGRPIWEVLHGECSATDVLSALDRRHGCDWLIPLHASDGQLQDKRLVLTDPSYAHFRDDETGEEWVFDRHGHWLKALDGPSTDKPVGWPQRGDPPHTRAEADEWLRASFPHLAAPPQPAQPDRTLREMFPERFLCGGVWPPFAGVAYALGFEGTLFLLHDDPSLLAYVIEQAVASVSAECAQLAADGFDGGLMCDSMASADIISPGDYGNWIAPMHRQVSDELHRVGLKSIMYNTGNILPMLEAVGALGYDVVSAEERNKGVELDIEDIRRQLGPDQGLFGNFDSYLLLRGERAGIRREVRRQIEAAGPRAFIMGTGSPICDATDPEAIDFWINEVRTVAV